MSEKDKKNIPEIRFDGFDEEWEKRILSDVVSQITTGLNPRDNFELNIGGENYYVTIKNFKQGQLFLDDNCDKIDGNALRIIQQRSQLAQGDILFASIGRVGDCYLVEKNPYNWNINESVFALKPKSDIARPEYLVHIIHSNSVLKQLTDSTTGSTFKSIKMSDLKKANLSTPSLEEQKKIAEFFKQLDKLIELNEKKVEKLEALKKSLLEKMFPVGGATTPQIRFDEFSDEWIFKELGKIGKTFTGLSGKTKEDFGHGNAKFITYMNVFSNPIINTEMTEAIEVDCAQNETQKGDVFFTTSSETPHEVGMSSVLLENQNSLYLNSFCFGFRPIEKIELNYLAYMLRSIEVRKKITFLAQGISRYNISKTKMMDIAVPLPNYNEQTSIGFILKLITEDIKKYQSKITKLRNLKISFLNKMIPHTHTHTQQ